MTIVSISKAAKITGKARSTIQTYIKTGKLSKTTDSVGKEGVDISELIRVFGELSTTGINDAVSQQTTPQNSMSNIEINQLKMENERLKILLSEKEERLHDKQAHIDSLKQALILLEYKEKKENSAINTADEQINHTPTLHDNNPTNQSPKDTYNALESEHITTTESVTTEKPKRKKFLGLF